MVVGPDLYVLVFPDNILSDEGSGRSYLLGDIIPAMAFQTPKLYHITKLWLYNLYLLDKEYIH